LAPRGPIGYTIAARPRTAFPPRKVGAITSRRRQRFSGAPPSGRGPPPSPPRPGAPIPWVIQKTGKIVWRQDYPLALDPNLFEGGTRSTPTLDGSRVYAVSHQGDLWCLDAASGQKIWYRHYQKDFAGRRPDWGYAGSPLAYGDLLICDVGAVGGSTVALRKETGEVVWKSGSEKAGYASPIVAELGGRATVIVFKADALIGCDLKDGKPLWSTPWKTSYDVNAATPLVIGTDGIFVSSGYGSGCALFKLQDGHPTLVWRNKNLRTHINSATILGDSIFGIDGDVGGGNLVCLGISDGNRRWLEKSVKGGSMIEADGKLIVFTEMGELVICDASPAGFHAISRGKVLGKRCWSQPTLDAGRLFLRNNEGDLVCVDLSGK